VGNPKISDDPRLDLAMQGLVAGWLDNMGVT
jgi:hypothetical protein